MSINSFDELLNIASKQETDLGKLKELQQYFIENVNFYYPEEIAQDIALNPENYKDFKKTFDSEDDKNREVSGFEKRCGETFHFSESIRKRITSLLGIVTEPTSKKVSLGVINIPGYNGSIVDVFRRIGNSCFPVPRTKADISTISRYGLSFFKIQITWCCIGVS